MVQVFASARDENKVPNNGFKQLDISTFDSAVTNLIKWQ